MNCTKFCGRIAGADLADLVLFLSFFLSFIGRDLDSTLTFSFFAFARADQLRRRQRRQGPFFYSFRFANCVARAVVARPRSRYRRSFVCLFFYFIWNDLDRAGRLHRSVLERLVFFLIWRKNKRVQGPSTGFRFHFFSFDLFLFVSQSRKLEKKEKKRKERKGLLLSSCVVTSARFVGFFDSFCAMGLTGFRRVEPSVTGFTRGLLSFSGFPQVFFFLH